jgi:cytochrome c-type biogenesis protein CcmH
MLWFAATVLAVIAVLWVAAPFLRKSVVEMNDSEGAMSVYRDQMDEVGRDHAAGLISEGEHDAALQEIERRALNAARSLDGGFSISHRSFGLAGLVAALAAVVALGGYAWFGSPAMPDQPLAARKTEILIQRAQSGDINARIALLIERTQNNPQSFEDWWTLAVSYASIGDDASSVEAYRRAAELAPDEPGVQAAYAEAMTLANGNKVPTPARVIFETVLRDVSDPRARYYVALAKAQAQDFEGALVDWVALKNDSSPDAPYLPLVRRDIVNMVRFLEWELTDVMPDATPAEIAAAGGASADDVNAARIAELEAQLSADPLDHENWIELATRLAQSGENERAATVLSQGAAHFAGAPFVQRKFDEAARALGMDILEDGVAQPTDEDVANITALPQAEQGDLIAGMVAGLAAELAERPGNPDKWIMLIRSYSVLGEMDKARGAYTRARAQFADNQAVLDQLSEQAGQMIGVE